MSHRGRRRRTILPSPTADGADADARALASDWDPVGDYLAAPMGLTRVPAAPEDIGLALARHAAEFAEEETRAADALARRLEIQGDHIMWRLANVRANAYDLRRLLAAVGVFLIAAWLAFSMSGCAAPEPGAADAGMILIDAPPMDSIPWDSLGEQPNPLRGGPLLLCSWPWARREACWLPLDLWAAYADAGPPKPALPCSWDGSCGVPMRWPKERDR